MCHPNKGLHGKAKSKAVGVRRKTKVKAKPKKVAVKVALNEAQKFFLMNEDVLN